MAGHVQAEVLALVVESLTQAEGRQIGIGDGHGRLDRFGKQGQLAVIPRPARLDGSVQHVVENGQLLHAVPFQAVHRPSRR